MTSPESSLDPRIVRQLRHDVDDVYDLLTNTDQTVNRIASAQRRQGSRLEGIQQAVDLQNGRLDRIEDTQRQILELLRGRPDETTSS